MENIQLEIHGRDVKVGDYYNYFTGNIVSGSRNKSFHPTETYTTTYSFDYPLTDELKRYMVGISPHLEWNINQNSIDTKQLWFSEYLKEEDPAYLARVSVIFRICQWTDKLELQNDYEIVSYEKECGGRATHLVKEVTYGAELIFSMQRNIHSTETKDSAKESIYFAAKSYFKLVMENGGLTEKVELPVELSKVSCKLYSSLEQSKQNAESSFEQLFDTINEYKKNPERWNPIEISLCLLSNQLKTRCSLENSRDLSLQFNRNKKIWEKILEDMKILWDHMALDRISSLKNALSQFYSLLKIFEKNRICKSDLIFANKKKAQTELKTTWDLLIDIMNWFIKRRKEFESISLLLSDTMLPVKDISELNDTMPTGDIEVNFYCINVACKRDPLISKIQEIVKNPDIIEFPFFPIILEKDETEISKHKKQLEEFEIFYYGESCYVALVPISWKFQDGKDYKLTRNNTVIKQDITEKNNTLVEVGKASKGKSENQPDIKSEPNSFDPQIMPTSITKRTQRINCTDKEQSKVQQQSKRICEILIENEYSINLTEKGNLTEIYLLKTKEKMNGTDFRWYEMLNSSSTQTADLSQEKHKIIIITGATRSGKSNHVNGLVNNILGVQWNDPFRFKITCEDSFDQAQTHNPIKLVRAYTIHHQYGMNIPYSITIIDTPGYNDDVVGRERDVSEAILRFLTKAKTAGINQIHAVCVVACANNFRPTPSPSQCHIFDSVFCTYDSAIKNYIRLFLLFPDTKSPILLKHRNPKEDRYFTWDSKKGCFKYFGFKEDQENAIGEVSNIWYKNQNSYENFLYTLINLKGKDIKLTEVQVHKLDEEKQKLKTIQIDTEIHFRKFVHLEILEKTIRQMTSRLKSKYKREPTYEDLLNDCKFKLAVAKTRAISLLEIWDSIMNSFDSTKRNLIDSKSLDYMNSIRRKLND